MPRENTQKHAYVYGGKTCCNMSAATVLHGNPLFAWELDAENFKDFWWVAMQVPPWPLLLGARAMQASRVRSR